MSNIDMRLKRLEQQIELPDDRAEREAELEQMIRASFKLGMERFGYDATPEVIEQHLEQRRMRLAERKRGLYHAS